MTLLLSTNLLMGQSNHWVGVGTGFSYAKVRDEANAPLLFEGSAFHLGLQYHNENGRQTISLSLLARSGQIHPKLPGTTNRLNLAQHYGGQFNVRYLKPIKSTKPWGIRWGGAWNTQLILNFYDNNTNNLAGYELNSSLDAASAITYRIDELWRLSLQIQFPLLSYSSRPEPTGLPPLDEQFAVDYPKIIGEGQWTSLSRVRYWLSTWAIHKKLKNMDETAFFYSWQSGSNLQGKALEYAFHTIGIRYTFSLNAVEN